MHLWRFFPQPIIWLAATNNMVGPSEGLRIWRGEIVNNVFWRRRFYLYSCQNLVGVRMPHLHPLQFRQPGECWYCQWSRLKERISLMRIDGWLRRQCSVVRRRRSATVAAARAEKRRTKKTSKKTRTRSANGFLFCLKSGPKKSFLLPGYFPAPNVPRRPVSICEENIEVFLSWLEPNSRRMAYVKPSSALFLLHTMGP